MAIRNGQFELLYPYARLAGTDIRVLPSAQGVIGDMAGQEFYEAAKHKGHLLCPGCEQAELGWRRGKSVAGDDRFQRDHFYLLPKSPPHALHCEIWQLGLFYPDPERRVDERKGGYVYANIQDVPPTQPLRLSFKNRSQLPDRRSRSLVEKWIVPIAYGDNRRGFNEIMTPDFIDRPRYRAVKDIHGFLKLLTHIPPEKLSDTWVVRSRVAVRLDKMVLREGASTSRDGDVPELHKQQAGLRPAFLMASNGAFDRFAWLLDMQRLGGRFPVLLHFNKASGRLPVTRDRNGQPEIKIDLPSFKVQNPRRLQGGVPELALPEVSVTRRLHFKDAALFDVIRGASTEFFALAHPYLIPDDRNPNGGFHQHFDVLRPVDLVAMTKDELAQAIRAVAQSRQHRSEAPQMRLVA